MHLVSRFAFGFLFLIAAFNLTLYAWRARRAAPCDADERLGLVNAIWAFAKESAALTACVALLAVGFLRPRRNSDGGTRGPIILLSGWASNRGTFWCLRRRLLRAGWGPVCCFDHRLFHADVEGAAQALREVVREVGGGGTRPLVLIGYGMGGLTLRYYVRRYPAPNIRRLITLGTPHGGTEVARLFGAKTAALLPGSRLMTALNAADHVPQQFDVISICSTFDATVLPASHGCYPDALNIEVNDVGHCALLFSSKVYRLLAENLEAPLR